MKARIGVAALVACWLAAFCALTAHSYADDSFIGFQYLRVLLSTGRFAWWAGLPPTEGVTNVGWLLAIAPLAALTGPAIAGKTAGWICVAGALAATFLVALRHLRETDALCAVAVAATSFELLYFSAAGMETGFLALVLLLTARSRGPVSGLLALPAFLAHPEAAVVLPLAALISRDRASAVRASVAVAAVAGATLARFLVFGAWIPNTALAKPTTIASLALGFRDVLLGRDLDVPWQVAGIGGTMLILAGAWRLGRDGAVVSAGALTGLLFAAWARADWTETARYGAPYLPFLAILVIAGVRTLVDSLVPMRADAGVAAVAVVLAGAGAVDSVGRMRASARQIYPGYVLDARPEVTAALWIAANLPGDAVIASRRIGALAFVGERRVFDWRYGLTDGAVARGVAARARAWDSPADPGLEAAWSAAAPGWILEERPEMDALVAAVGGTDESFTVQGISYQVRQELPLVPGHTWVLAGPPR